MDSNKLEAWLAAHIPDVSSAKIVEHSGLGEGHSNETVTLVVKVDGGAQQKFVVRAPPEGPGLLEPYDMTRQYKIMDGLKGSKIPVPNMIGLEEHDLSIWGRPFFVMEHIEGMAFEIYTPDYVTNDLAKSRRMSEAMTDMMADLHQVDWRSRGLGFMGDGSDFLDAEVAWFQNDIHRVQRSPFPGLDYIADWLHANKPDFRAPVAIVHGDYKPGNMYWNDERLVGLFDWEITRIGDPLADLAYHESVVYSMGGGMLFPNGLAREEMLARYQEKMGFTIPDEAMQWHRVLQYFKLAAIFVVSMMLFENGHTNDLRFMGMGMGIQGMARLANDAMGGEGADVPIGNLEISPTRFAEAANETLQTLILPLCDSTLVRRQAEQIGTGLNALAARFEQAEPMIAG